MTDRPTEARSTRLRTHTCGDLRREDVGREVALCGWIHNRRDLGGVLFLDLRDHYGLTQLVVRAEHSDELGHTPKETVIRVRGSVLERSADTINSALATGEVEVELASYEVLGPADPLPFSIFPEEDAPEDTRLRYRFLDLRRSVLHRTIVLRAQVIGSIRRRMEALGFVDIHTPTLTASSPEGARDYLVPSRVHPGRFYALPQAPQQFKQLLMTAGFDRYYQIAPCYRDEDARADRSPGEFYQLDLEMSFVEQDDVFEVCEAVFPGLFEEFRPDCEIARAPFPRIAYDDALDRFGTDKPDLRIPLEIADLTELLGSAGIRAFDGKVVKGLSVPTAGSLSRAGFDQLVDIATELGAGGLAWFAVEQDASLRGPLARHVPEALQARVRDALGAEPGHALLLVADADADLVRSVLGALRLHVAERFELIEPDAFRFCWIVDFPMYERDAETGAIDFSHNPFSMPQGGLEALDSLAPLDVKAFQYDLVCNGEELSSGAIRNHRPDIMYRAFQIAGYTPEQVDERFGALGRAFKLGAPPHGGIAPGIDRIVMLLAGAPNLREVIAFPMNQRAQDLMMGAPSEVSEEQLRELHLRLRLPPGAGREA